MATTWEFFYTVESYHDLADSYNDVDYNANVTDYDGLVDDFIAGNQKYVIKMHNEYRISETGVEKDTNGIYIKPVTQIGEYRTFSKVPQKADIIYYVKFYMQKKINGVINTTYWLPSGYVYDVTRNVIPEYKPYLDFGSVETKKTGQVNGSDTPKSEGAPSKIPGVKVNSAGGATYKFRVTFNPAAAGKTLNPPFTMSAKFRPEEFLFPHKGTGTIINPNANTVNITKLAGVNPAITVSAAKLPPRAPATIWDWQYDNIVVTGKPGVIGTISATIVYDFCGIDGTGKKPRFYGVKTQKLVTPGKNNEYLYEVVSCAPGQDTTLTVLLKGTEPAITGGQLLGGGVQAGKKITAERKTQFKMVIGNCTTKAVTEQDEDDSTTMKPPVETQLPTDKLRWNPPPHRVTSTESFGARMSSLYNDILGSSLDPAFSYGDEFIDLALKAAEGKYSKFEKVRIFQDNFGAKSLNRAYKKAAKQVSGTTGNNNLWGFRATYNPTTFSYSTAANTDVDWTLGAKDPAILLAGNQTVSFDIYLNRIADLNVVRPSTGTGPVAGTSKMYPRPLEVEESNGIYYRGTEYDLEFLYRVITGDPEKKNLLLSPKYRNLGGVTADLGYTTAVPCWLYLNENMRYYGSVASIQVNHVMFDLRMVPMLSVVTLTFARYPVADQGAEPKKLLEKQQGVALDTKSKD